MQYAKMYCIHSYSQLQYLESSEKSPATVSMQIQIRCICIIHMYIVLILKFCQMTADVVPRVVKDILLAVSLYSTNV